MKTLTTKATDNHGHSYPVTIKPVQHGGFAKQDWLLTIEGAGAGWFMTTLEEKPSDKLFIDFGSNWYCDNFDAILAEARTILASEDRLTQAEVKAYDDNMWASMIASAR